MADETPPSANANSPADEPPTPTAATEPAAAEAVAPVAERPVPQQQTATDADLGLSQLLPHTRSLMKIKVAVSVNLAHQRRPIHDIIEMSPGTLVKFEKTYDEPLELTVDGVPIARGEVVKVGDKFGLRIGKIIRPHERFASIG